MTRIPPSQNGLARWRQAAIQRRGVALVPAALATKADCPATTRLGAAPSSVYLAASKSTIQIGEFVISPEGDPRILGHPQIRY